MLKTLTEIRRHLVFKLTGRPGVSFFRQGRAGREQLSEATTSGRFSAIYAKGIWKNGRADMPGSGPGSGLEATATLRHRLPVLLDQIGSEVLLDLGCGDFTWMKEVSLRQDYIGVDIVPSVIERNRVFSNPRRRFACLNAITDPLPDADTILCREVLFHLSFEDGRRALRNLLAKPRRWLIATSDTSTKFNADIHTGDYRPLNLRCAPFRFPAPDTAIEDDAVGGGRLLAAWRAERLPA